MAVSKKKEVKGLNREKEAKKEFSLAKRRARLVCKELLHVLREDFSINFFRFDVKAADLWRLTIFQSWSERYSISLHYVLRELIAFWRERTRRPGKKSVLGVTIPVLTSSKSEEILREKILKDFPSGENISQHKLQEQRRLLGLAEPRGKVKSLIDEDRPEQSCILYGERIQRRRRRLDSAAAGQRRKRRAWRGNPWL